jgi:hypothetical protein
MAAEDIVGIRHQATTGEDKADCEDLVCAVVNCRAYELDRMRYSYVLLWYVNIQLPIQTPSIVTHKRDIIIVIN